MADRTTSPRKPPFVRRTGDALTLHFARHEIQSRMSLLQPDALDLAYTRMMMGFLLFAPAPAHIAMVGLGGGSLAKFCHRHLPESRITVAEVDPAVIALRDTFLVPADDERFAVVQQDGADFVRRGDLAPDVLLLDGFDAAGLPAQLCTQGFYDDCHEMLAPDGIMVANLHVNRPHRQASLERIRNRYGAAVFEVMDDDMTNSVVFACKNGRVDTEGLALTRPAHIGKDAWRQLMPTFRLIEATLQRW